MINLCLRILKYNFIVTAFRKIFLLKNKNLYNNHFIIASFPKSGNTYVRLVLQHYIYGESNLDTIDFQLPYAGISKSLETKTILKTHDLPNKYMTKGVYIHRKPSETLNSFYRSSYRRGLYIPFNLFNMLDKLNLLSFYGSLIKHIKKWQEHTNNCSNWLIVNYDDLIQNPFTEFSKIIIHLKIVLEEEKLKNSISNCSIKNVKILESKSVFIQEKLKIKGAITGASFENVKSESNYTKSLDKLYNSIV